MEIKKGTLLYEMNPTMKLVIIILLTILLTFSYDQYTPLITFFLLLMFISFGTKTSIFKMIWKMIPFIYLGFTLFLFLMLPNSFNAGGDMNFLVFQFNREVLINNFAIALRLICFALMSIGFIMSTEPRDFVMSLIQQCKIPYVIGYSFLSAYRFLPSFREDLRKISLAHEIRGERLGNNILGIIIHAPKYLIPFLSVSIRKGERIALAMESRGLKLKGKRNYYRRLKVKKVDWLIFLLAIIYIILVILITSYFNLSRFSLGL